MKKRVEEMKKIIVGVLLDAAILCHPITAKANALSYIPPEEVDGIPEEISWSTCCGKDGYRCKKQDMGRGTESKAEQVFYDGSMIRERED